MTSKIIAISGKSGSGKDTVASIFRALEFQNALSDMWEPLSIDELTLPLILKKISKEGWYSKFKVLRIANSVKKIASVILGVPIQQFEDQKYKETTLGEEWWYYKSGTTLTPYSTPNPIGILIKPTPRMFLQLIGTEFGRNIIHPNVWVNSAVQEIKDTVNSHILIPDLRFLNEKTAIESLPNNFTIRVRRDNISTMEHASETELDDVLFDFVILNNGSVSDLAKQVTKLYKDLEL